MSDKPLDYWTFFAQDAARIGSPLYSRLALGIGEDEDLKAQAVRARAGQPPANMILGAVHFLLLRGADHPLRRHYRDLGTPPPEGEDPFPLFKDFVIFITTRLRISSKRASPTQTKSAGLPFFMRVFAH